ncbi:peptidyl-prolyl cis-trans isomerase [Candidatus Uabimicrobium sp. HlEnr_7]|uniref:peptidylprolyl isomerase n=1 Tax=Candidatus Uabimicrobium helgolandensis TaxID=3095367 RepID=UPI0035575B32
MKWLYCVFLICVPIFSQQQRSDTIVAIVNKDIITYGDVLKKVKSIIQSIEASGLPRKQKELRKAASMQAKLRDMVDTLLMQQEAKKYKLELPNRENIKKQVEKQLKKQKETRGLDEFALEDVFYSRELLRNLLQARSAYSQGGERRADIDTFVQPAEICQYYKDNLGKYTKPPKIKTRIITLFYSKNDGREQTRAKAESIVRELRNEADFAEIAKLYSNDPYAESGGDWPRKLKDNKEVWDFIGKGELPKEVDDIAFSMSKGEISEPIMLDGESYCQIVKIEDMVEGGAVPFTEVQPEIRRRLQNEKIVSALKGMLTQLRRRSFLWPENIFRNPNELE